MRFSDRIGITQPKTTLQVEEIDDDLKNAIWEIVSRRVCLGNSRDIRGRPVIHAIKPTYELIHTGFYKLPSDTLGGNDDARRAEVRHWYFQAKWYEIYNFIEFICLKIDPQLSTHFNRVLELEKSAYRFIDGQLVPITDDVELESIASAIGNSHGYSGARQHLENAIDAFSKKPEPDHANVVREAILAVESIAKVLTGNEKATLGEALNALDDQKTMHGAFKDGFKKLYGYTSDEKGIRHALLDNESQVTEAEAHFMIVVCSAFVNFAISHYQ